jgi:hypothetical protein
MEYLPEYGNAMSAGDPSALDDDPNQPANINELENVDVLFQNLAWNFMNERNV